MMLILKNLRGCFQNLISLSIVSLFLMSCATQSGRYVYHDGKWVFQKSQTGFVHFSRSHRIDSSPLDGSELGRFMWPVPSSKNISSHFGKRGKRHHDGIDISARYGASIVASESGKVVYAGRMSGYGRIVIIKHDSQYHSVYAHNSKNLVKKGQSVSKGEVIGHIGSSGRSTGPHLHFELRKKNRVRNPIAYLPAFRKVANKN